MTQKLKILGPYTPEHEGPYAFNGEVCVVHAVLGYQAFISRPESDEGFIARRLDVKNAEEVQQPREFWVNEYSWGFGPLVTSCEEAIQEKDLCRYIRTIHVREVTPGEDA